MAAPDLSSVHLMTGDVVLVKRALGWSPATWVPFLIRVCSRSRGEEPTRYNHVGIMADPWNIVEASAPQVRLRRVRKAYCKRGFGLAVYRRALTGDGRRTLRSAARAYLSRRYGFGKIVTHFVDWCLSSAAGRDLYVARRLSGKRYPICSWLVAWCYKKVGKPFLTEIAFITPDDIGDECERVEAYVLGGDFRLADGSELHVGSGPVQTWQLIYKSGGL